MTYIDCVVDGDYEIFTEFPYPIRRKDNHRIVSEYVDNSTGYPCVALNGRKKLKHIIVAHQFIINDDPEHKTDIDHINTHRDDYHIENLRYVSRSTNQKNKSSHKGVDYEYIEDDDIPDDLILVSDYGEHEFEDYYYSEQLDRFLFDNGVRTRLLHINYTQGGSAFVNAIDTNNRQVKIYYSTFKRLYGIRN